MEQSEKEAIRERTDIVELISGYTTLKRVGGKYKGLCPFHSERTPSFNVDPEQGRWYCFGACGMGGDVFKFIEKAENLSFIEAAQRLAERAGITLTPRGGDREAAQRQQSEKERAYAVNAAALQFFRDCLRRDDAARAYTERRGLIHSTLEDFQIGYAPDDWSQLTDFFRKQKIHLEDAEKAGLIFPSSYNAGAFTDRFRGRLLFPIVDVQERVVGFGGRIIGDGQPKYLNSPETPVFSKSRVLYGLNRARKAIQERDLVLVVEGYMDVVAAHQAGLAFVVATLGTSLTEDHVRMIRRYTKNVVLSFDADDAGVKAALRAAELFGISGEDVTLRVLSLPPGEDPDSLLAKGDVAGFHKAIENAVTVPEFRLTSIEKRHDVSNDTGKLALLREAVAIIAAVPSTLQQDMLIRRVAGFHPDYGTNSLRAEESVRAEVRRASGGNAPLADDFLPSASAGPGFRRGGPTAYRPGGAGGEYRRKGAYGRPDRTFVQPDGEPTPRMPAAWAAAEQTLLQALLSEEWFGALRLAVGDTDLQLPSDDAQNLFQALWPLLTGNMTLGDALDQLTDPALVDHADSLRMAILDTPLSPEAIEDALRQLDRLNETRKLREIVERPKEGNGSYSDEQLRQWSETARTQRSPAKLSDSG